MLISQLSYAVVVVCFKWSILALYWRLFHFQRQSIRIFIWALAAIVFLWGIAVVCPKSQLSFQQKHHIASLVSMLTRLESKDFDPHHPVPARLRHVGSIRPGQPFTSW